MIRAKLRERRGASFIQTILIFLVSLIFFAVLIEIVYMYSMMMGISDYLQEAVLQTAASNAYNAYGGVREGNSSAHAYAGSGAWHEMVTTAEVTQRLQDMLELERRGNGLYKMDGGETKYAISSISVACRNVEVGHEGNTVKLTFLAEGVAEVPFTFMRVTVIVRKPLSLTSYYTPLY